MRRCWREIAAPMALASILLGLAACGGGGTSTRPQTTPQAAAPPPVAAPSALEVTPRVAYLSVERVTPRAVDLEDLLATGGPVAPQGSARQAPLAYLDANEAYWKLNPSHWNRRALDGRWHVGGDVSPVADHALPTIRHHDATAVSYGEIRDGVGRDKVVRYLEQMATGHWAEYGSGLFTLDTPPVVRLAEGTDQTFRDYVVRAVRIINSALPNGWKMQISEETFPADQTDLYLPEPRPGRGEIFVVFAQDPSACAACYLSFAEWEWDSINLEWNYPQNSGGLAVIDPSEWRPIAEGRSRSDWEQIILAMLVRELVRGANPGMKRRDSGFEVRFGQDLRWPAERALDQRSVAGARGRGARGHFRHLGCPGGHRGSSRMRCRGGHRSSCG